MVLVLRIYIKDRSGDLPVSGRNLPVGGQDRTTTNLIRFQRSYQFMSDPLQGLVAGLYAAATGLRWKTWLKNEKECEGIEFYCFEDRENER